ncbi:MAG TPA: DUF4810 domain-containing protein [Rhodocyclaceae bacterium]|nr:DUF4810 domain-containing protein [Rhodocyclaceae bacterium]
MRRHLLLAAVSASLCACATTSNSIYQWGSYDNALYASYKDPNQVEALRVKLETLIADREKAGQKVAPGLYAELGTIYLQSGAADKASAMYAKEKDAWPESKTLMDAMIKNIERRKVASAGAKS